MSVLDRTELEASPLADLHLIANQLGVDGFRRLRKADLIDAILGRQDGEEPAVAAEDEAEERPARARRGRRGGRGRARDIDSEAEADAEEATAEAEEAAASADDESEDESAGRRRRRGGRREEVKPAEERVVSGVVELQGNGSGFVRVNHPEASDDDVYVSAAQVKRCELVSGDRVSGPVRAPRRSERFASLIRIDTINDRPADEVAEGTKFDELPAAFPTERLELGGEDPTVNAVEWLTPFGRGSRVVVCGGPRSGKSELLHKVAAQLAGRDGLELSVVLAGCRPEEAGEWSEPIAPAAVCTFAASADAQAQAIEGVVEQGRRVAARGGDAVVIVDSLTYLQPQAARRILAAARNIAAGGSLTIVAGAAEPVGGETTVVVLDAELVAQRRFPALDLLAGGTLRPELLVGDAGAEEIARKRAEFAAEVGRR